MHRLQPAIGRSLVLYLVAGLAVLAGCAGGRPAAELAIEDPYPAEAAYADAVDVVVVRHGKRVQLVNREARTFPAGQLWLNRGYMRPIDRVEIGANAELPLEGFRNAYGEGYPTGSFLRPERLQRLVLAELYDPQSRTRYRLTVQPDERPRMD